MTKKEVPLAIQNAKKDPSDGYLSWKKIPIGGVIPAPGNSVKTLTGKWAPKKTIWDSEKCTRCNQCLPTCPDSCLLKDENGKMCGIDEEHCKNCGLCVEACPFGALNLEDKLDS